MREIIKNFKRAGPKITALIIVGVIIIAPIRYLSLPEWMYLVIIIWGNMIILIIYLLPPDIIYTFNWNKIKI